MTWCFPYYVLIISCPIHISSLFNENNLSKDRNSHIYKGYHQVTFHHHLLFFEEITIIHHFCFNASNCFWEEHSVLTFTTGYILNNSILKDSSNCLSVVGQSIHTLIVSTSLTARAKFLFLMDTFPHSQGHLYSCKAYFSSVNFS